MESDRVVELVNALKGIEVRTDEETLESYSLDRSPFRRRPAAVLAARDAGDVEAGVRAAAGLDIPVTPRAGGSSVAGQCLGEGLVIDVSALDGIEPVDPESVWAGAGVSLDRLNAELARHGRAIGPDVMSSRWARVGGLVATDACGSRSLRYGRFRGALAAADVVLADGTTVSLARGETPRALEVGIGAALDGLDGDLGEWPALQRDPGGYRLPDFARRRDALALLPGSEGTLGVITRARLETVPAPSRCSLAVASFDSLSGALEAAPAVAAAGASAAEVLDVRLAAAARDHGLDAIEPGAAALVVETLGEDGHASTAIAGASRIAELDGEMAELAWRLRGSALARVGGDGRSKAEPAGDGRVALACFEDVSVPAERTAEYCTRLLATLDGLGMEAIVYGHAGAGCLHVRPLCDPSDPRLAERLLDATSAACELAAQLGGVPTGEHGWGLSRSHLVERSMGSAIAARFEAVKRAFDPAGVLNPGIVVGGRDPRDLVSV